jgi:hypothetical protein
LGAVQAHASDPAYVDELIQRVDKERLYEERAWEKLLFMRHWRIRPTSGMFDDPLFYLGGPQTRKDPRGEMIAAIRRFAAPDKMQIEKENRHPQCFYPARFAYLRERLKIDDKRFTIQECPELDKYIRFAQYNAISLVFSNYYADNPASMFGHTLLRMHHSDRPGEVGLLDDAANFAAQVGVMNPLTYPFEGLFGLFKGRFALVPYSEKIQEYNNYESRDLWEYELNLTPFESRRLALELWEVGYFSMNYYYLEQNCSYIILALIETVKPDLDLVGSFYLYAIPSDTVKAVTKYPDMVRGISFKPSARTRYLERAQYLQGDESRVFLKVLDRFENSFSKEEFESLLGGCDAPCRVRLFDTLIEYIDYKEKKVSTKKVTKYADLRKNILLARSRIPQTSPPFTYRPEKSRPDLGPRASMIEFSSGWTQKGFNNSEFRWRPAHHDFSSSALGYSDLLQIEIMDTIIAHAADIDKYYLKHFSPIETQSLGAHELALSPLSWRFELSFDTDRDMEDRNRLFQRSEMEVGIGTTRVWGPFGAFLMADARAGYSTDPNLFWHAGFGPFAGAWWTFSDQLKFSTKWNWIKAYGHHSTERREVISRLAYSWHKENEASFDYRDQDGFYYWGLGYRLYY